MKLSTVLAVALFAVLSGNAAAQVIELQSFDSSTAAATAGWTGFRNNLNGNSFGFSNSNFTGGQSGANEAGGTVARTTDLAFYGDTTVGGVLNLNFRIQSSGELIATSVGAFNNGVRIGFFNSGDVTGLPQFVGFQVAEPQAPASAGLRVFGSVHLADGSRIEGSGIPLRINLSDTYTWTSDWNPIDRLLTLEMFDSNGLSIGSNITDLSPGELVTGSTLNAFGMLSGGVGQANPSNTADVFIDNVTYSYSVVPEPSGMLLVASAVVGVAMRFRSRRDRSH